MKKYSNALGSVTVICTLAACGGGSSGDLPQVQSASAESVNDSALADDAVNGGDMSGLLSLSRMGVANPTAVNDLTISGVSIVAKDAAMGVAMNDSSDSIEFQFDVSTGGSDSIELDALSVILEVAVSGSFVDSYRLPLFDIRSLVDSGISESSNSDNLSTDAGTLAFTARSTVADLPSGNYSARLVVNPNWQNVFDVMPPTVDQSLPFHFLEETDYNNNVSNDFSINVVSTLACVEDEFEQNDSFANATVIPIGGQITASLCNDTVDFFSVDLAAGASTSIYFDYAETTDKMSQASKYMLFDNEFRVMRGSVAREANDIEIRANAAGTYYLAVYGQRSDYRLTREPTQGTALPPNFANDFSNSLFFTAESVAGPDSWLLGPITLQKLAFTESDLEGQVVDCGRITTQFRDDAPVAYVTPRHFADIYTFRFFSDGEYFVDSEAASGWSVQEGDIVNSHWYQHDYPGYAQKIDEHGWRYWSSDGLSYVECVIEAN